MSIYPATVRLPQSGSLVSRWLLDEASGERADIVGSNPLSDNNSVLQGAGYSNAISGVSFDNAANFERDTDEYLSHIDNAALSLTGDLSFFHWINMESAVPTNNNFDLMSKWDTNQKSWIFRINDTGGTVQLRFVLNDTGSGSSITKGVNWSPTANGSTWYYVGMVYDASAGEVDFYVNGAAQGTTQSGLYTDIPNTTADFMLGRRGDASNPYDGLMNDAALWGAEVTAANALALYKLYTTAPPFGSPIFY